MTTEKPDRKPRAKPPVSRKSAPSDPAANTATPAAAQQSKGKVRLQRALASAGYGSRRQCEDLIIEGRILVDGHIVTELGVSIEPGVQKVFVDGTPLKPRKLVYYALNKPVGVVTTNVDPEGRPRVIDLVPPDERVFPVGRLDRSSEGLILLTNDGELAQRLAHPRYEVQKVYRVTVAGKIDVDTMRQMERGIHIAEGMVKVEGARVLKTRGRATEMEITLKEGKNREIRRILARLGHKVQQLKRIAIGPLRLGEMPSGAYRKLSFEELKKLKASVLPASGRRDDNQTAGDARSNGDGARRLPPRKGVKKGAAAVRDPARKKFGVKSERAGTDSGRVPSGGRTLGGGKSQGRGSTLGGGRTLGGGKTLGGDKSQGSGKTLVGGKNAGPRSRAVGNAAGGKRPSKQPGELLISPDKIVSGSVIGADPLPPSEERPARRKKTIKKKTSTTRSFGRGTKKRPRADSLSRSAKSRPVTKRSRDSRKDD